MEHTGLPSAITDIFDSEIVSSEHLPQCLTDLLRETIHHLHAEYASLHWLDRHTNTLVLKAKYGHGVEASPEPTEQCLPCQGQSTIAKVAETKALFAAADLSRLPEPWQYHRQEACRSGHAALAVPLLDNDGGKKVLVGVLNIDGPPAQVTTPQGRKFLQNLAQYTRRMVSHAEFFQAMHSIGTQILTMDRQAVLDRAVQECVKLLYVPVCSIWLIDNDTGRLVLEKAIGRPPTNEQGEKLSYARESFIGKALRENKILRCHDVRKDKQYINRAMAISEGWVSGFAVPIRSAQGEAIGVIHAVAKEKREFKGKYCRIASFVAKQMAITLQQSAVCHRLSSLQDISTALGTTLRLDDLLPLIVEQATQLLAGAGGIIYLRDRDQDNLIADASCGIAKAAQGTSAALDTTLVGWVSQHNTPVRCLAHDSRVDPQLVALVGNGTIVAVPLGTEKRSLGTLCVLNKQGGTGSFDDADLALLQTFASHAAIAITKTRQAQRLHMLNRIFQESAESRDIDALLRTATARIHGVFGYWTSIGMRAPKHLISSIVNYEGTAETSILSLDWGITSRVATTGKALLENDVKKTPFYSERSSETRAELAVPLFGSEGHPIGVLNIESKQPNAFGPEDREMFETVATGVSHAIANAYQRTRLSALHTLAEAVGRAQHLPEVLGAFYRTLSAHFHINAAALYLCETQTQRLSPVNTHGFSDRELIQIPWVATLQRLVEQVFQTAQAEVRDDILPEPRTNVAPTVTQDLHALVAVPIRTDTDVLGVLVVATKTQRPFPDYEIALLMDLGKSVSVEIEKAYLYQELTETKDKYRRLFEGARDPFLILDEQGTILDVNEGTTLLCGYEKEELIGQRVPKLLIINSEQQEEIANRLSRAMNGDTVEPREFEMRHKNGSTFIIESNLSPILHNRHQVIAIHAMWRDVTLRVALLDICRAAFQASERDVLLAQAAARVRTLIESHACAIYLYNGVPTRLESAFPSSPGELPETTIVTNVLQQVVETRTGHIQNQINASGSCLQHLLAVPLLSDDTLLGVLSVMRHGNQGNHLYTPDDCARLQSLADVLTLALEYQRLAEAHHKQQMAIKALEQVSLVGAFLGHKLGGFLGSLSLKMELLARQISPGDHPTVLLLDGLVAQGRAASRFAEGFRNMAKPLNASQEICAVGALVKQALEHLQRAGMLAQTRLDVARLCLPSVRANQALLLEVIECLLRNALDAMSADGRLSVEGGTTLVHDHRELWIHFKDTGVGMAPEVLKALFTPFFTTKKNAPNLGIGLWLARLYLQTLGGDLEAASVVGQGSTFTLRLPTIGGMRPRSKNAAAVVAPKTGRDREGQKSAPKQFHVLVVEDEPDWQALLPAMLLHYNIQTQVAQDRAEALRYLAQHSFDAFILDVRLISYEDHNADGLDIAQQIRAQDADAPVLLLSGWLAQLTQARHFAENTTNVHVADKTHPPEVEEAIKVLCTVLSTTRTSLYSA